MRYKLVFLIITSLLIPPWNAFSSSEVIIIKSSDIIPYQKAIEGFKQSFPGGTYTEYSIEEDFRDTGKSIVARAVNKGGDLIVAVGPQAAYLMNTDSSSIPKVFTMVLDPEKFLGNERLYPGVSLNIPLGFQLEQIRSGFPARKRVGVFYTQEQNQKTIDTILPRARGLGLSVTGIPIVSPKEIPELLKSLQSAIDILWVIPDRTIGSEKILKYLLKSVLMKNIPVVGFNEWFAENGAILSFDIDYEAIGRQTGELAQKLLQPGNPPTANLQEPQQVRTIINLKVAQKLSVTVAEELMVQASEVIK
jgi:putative ABC transport system substrate-binding protein